MGGVLTPIYPYIQMIQEGVGTNTPAPPSQERNVEELSPRSKKRATTPIAQAQGANSLQIPLGQISGGSGIGTI